MATVFLLRHGETEWNVAGRFQGKLDSALTATGMAQAEACGRRLAEIAPQVDTLVASPLGRTRTTTAIIGNCAELPEPVWDNRLAEVSTGCWDGLTQCEIDAQWPGLLDGATAFDWYFRSPDGEKFDAATARARDWLGELRGTVVAVSHGLLGRLIRGAYLGLGTAETLALPVPQDLIWRMHGGQIEGIPVQV